jgi:predicted porin
MGHRHPGALGAGPLETSVALTSGTLSNPLVRDDNRGKQVSGRAALMPVPGLVIGASAARGEWLASDVPRSREGTLAQTAAGLDAEYARGHWLVTAEAVLSRWALPFPAATANGRDVRAAGAWLEARYRVAPRMYVAARADRLTFSRIPRDGLQPPLVPWDAPVTRLEAAAGYYVQRNVVARIAVQANWRDDSRIRRRTYVASQLGWWF